MELTPEQRAIPIIPAPSDPAEWPAFRDALVRWRKQERAAIAFDDTRYRRPEFQWAASSFCCCLAMLWDTSLYDPNSGRYSVESFLDDGERRFGGYDSVVLWHAYPRIGFDDRNQFDFYREMPGGLAGLRELSRKMRQRGVRVYIDYNPWDNGTRPEGRSDIDSLVEIVREIEADGIFLDTMEFGLPEFRQKLDSVRPGVVLEGENALPLDRIHDHHMSWAQEFDDSPVPGILRNKWFERRHMQHQIRRWRTDHTAEIQAAWMNGSGVMVWENVFGSLNPWGPAECASLRAMLPIQRRFASLLCGEGWTPLAPTLASGVYANLWEGGGVRLWTLVNRAEQPATGPILAIEPKSGNEVYFDLIRGVRLHPEQADGAVALRGEIAPRGIGCFAAGPADAFGSDFSDFLTRQRLVAAAGPSTEPRVVPESALCPVCETVRAPVAPAGMTEIPAVEMVQRVEFQRRECGFYRPYPMDTASGAHGPLHQTENLEHQVTLGRYAIDITPVTNSQFAQFVAAVHYRPSHSENFLKHWVGIHPHAGQEDHPVVFVDLDDARAYAAWAGKRLPTEAEWQFAAEGHQALRFPWGIEAPDSTRCNAGEAGGTTPVTTFPAGRSPFGCLDMCGNVWEWTQSERTDGRNRFAILKGGSYYRAQGSCWYSDGGAQTCQFCAKFLRVWPGLDRCATIGFRCAVDLA